MLYGALTPSDLDCDLLALAINDRFLELGCDHPVPCTDSTWASGPSKNPDVDWEEERATRAVHGAADAAEARELHERLTQFVGRCSVGMGFIYCARMPVLVLHAEGRPPKEPTVVGPPYSRAASISLTGRGCVRSIPSPSRRAGRGWAP